MNDPLQKFKSWYGRVRDTDEREPSWMALATATKDGRPSVRIVLLKGIKDDAFYFYTNYDSRKGAELKENPYAALAFYWNRGTEARQVRVEGRIEKASVEDSNEYWASRPRGSQVSGSISPQSQRIRDFKWLSEQVSEMEKKTGTQTIPRPENWGGYLLIPNRIEFWTGKENRLHEREVYSRENPKTEWKIEFLAP